MHDESPQSRRDRRSDDPNESAFDALGLSDLLGDPTQENPVVHPAAPNTVAASAHQDAADPEPTDARAPELTDASAAEPMHAVEQAPADAPAQEPAEAPATESARAHAEPTTPRAARRRPSRWAGGW